jgi:aminoglycoside/choline kinase family phosphotransferase
MDTSAAALLPALLATAGLPPDPGCELVRQVFPFSGVWRLRFGQSGGATVIYKHARAPLDREHVALAYAASCGIPVPRVIAARQQDGWAGVLMTDLGQPARPSTGADAAPLAARIHRAPGNGLPVIDAAALAAMPERIAASAARHGLSAATARTAAALARNARPLAAPAMIQPLGLCHSEWHPDSILIDADGQPHVYDWARAFAGPGLLDLASWRGTQAAPDLTATRALITAYVQAGGHSAALTDRAGLPAEAWALGWHRLWAADWYLQQLDIGWIPDQYLTVQRQAIERHTAEAAALLRP